MSDTSDTSPTVVDVYESCLGRSLERKDLSRSPLTPKDLSTFALALSNHYRTYRLPRKAVPDLRPSISPGFTTSRSVGLDYVFGTRHFRGTFDFKFDTASQGEMTLNLKRYLLYCHGIVIQDPLPYLLDYFENGRTSEAALARLPAVHALLSEYADLGGTHQETYRSPCFSAGDIGQRSTDLGSYYAEES